MCTAAELIAKLQTLSPDTIIMCPLPVIDFWDDAPVRLISCHVATPDQFEGSELEDKTVLFLSAE
jgi:hypothetical protein